MYTPTSRRTYFLLRGGAPCPSNSRHCLFELGEHGSQVLVKQTFINPPTTLNKFFRADEERPLSSPSLGATSKGVPFS